MAKNKKDKKENKGKNKSFYKSIKPIIKNPRVLYSILGAAGVGVALASAFGTDKGRSILDTVSGTLQSYGLLPAPETETSVSDDQPAVADGKKTKGSRSATLES